MKYYNKDYENFVIDDKTEIRVEKQHQDDEEIRKIENAQRPFKSLIDRYRDSHNGYPSYSILFLSLFAAGIITFITTMIIGFTLVDLNIITDVYFGKILLYILPLWVLAIMVITYIILNYVRKFFVQNDER